MNLTDINQSWKAVLSEEFHKPYFLELCGKVKAAYASKPQQIFPKETQLYKAFEACSFEQLQVVILAQDPYPTKGHAHGLCFSVETQVYPIPRSLSNIFKELHADTGQAIPDNGNLSRWAKQGVLLLNNVLTVEEGLPDSHKNYGWEKFTDAVVTSIASQKNNIVFILWGAKAQAKASQIDPANHLILKAAHPSPLAAHRGFFGCKHFSKTNAFLRRVGKKEIKW